MSSNVCFSTDDATSLMLPSKWVRVSDTGTIAAPEVGEKLSSVTAAAVRLPSGARPRFGCFGRGNWEQDLLILAQREHGAGNRFAASHFSWRDRRLSVSGEPRRGEKQNETGWPSQCEIDALHEPSSDGNAHKWCLSSLGCRRICPFSAPTLRYVGNQTASTRGLITLKEAAVFSPPEAKGGVRGLIN